MSQFLLGILASLVAGIALLFGGRLSRRWRQILLAAANAITGADIDQVYPDKTHAEADLRQLLRKANEVCIFAGRGNELQRLPFSSLFLHRSLKQPVRIRILLPDTSPNQVPHDWTLEREQELATFDPAFGVGLLHKQIEANVAFLRGHLTDGRVELRRFNVPHIGRIVLVDGVCHYTPYKKDAHGRESRVYRFRQNGDMSANLLRFFELLWNTSKVEGKG